MKRLILLALTLGVTTALLSPAVGGTPTPLRVTGVVQAKDGSGPVAGIDVCLSGEKGKYYYCGSSDAEGHYTVKISAGPSYVMSARNPGFYGEFIDQVRNGGKPFKISKSFVANWSMVRGASISGHLRPPAEQPLAHADLSVWAYRVDSQGRTSGSSRYGSNIAESGYFYVSALPAGRYRLLVEDSSADRAYARQWYPDASAASTSTPLSVTTAQDLTDTDITLHHASAMRVRVKDKGKGLKSLVKIVDRDGRYVDEAVTDDDGLVVFGGLHAGSYKVKASPHAFRYDEWYAGKRSVAQANLIHVGSTETAARTFTLSRPKMRATRAPRLTFGDDGYGVRLLKASAATWAVRPDRVAYRWYSAGHRIMVPPPGTRYEIRGVDVGRKVKVCAIGVRENYENAQICSASKKITHD